MPGQYEVHQDQVLTNLSIRYSNLAFVADVLLPRVKVAKKSDVYYIYGRESFILPESRRAPRTNFNQVDFSVSTGTYSCIEYGLEGAIDDNERDNADSPLNLDMDVAEYLTDLVLLGKESRAVTLLTDTSVLTQYTTLSGTSQFSDYANSDPIGVVDTGRSTIELNSGKSPNVLVLGSDVYNKLKEHPAITEKIKYSQKGVVTPDLIAAVMNIDRVVVAGSIYNSARQGQSESMARLWGKNMILAYVEPNPGLRKVSLGYTMEWKGRITEKYRDNKKTSDIIRVKEHVDEKVVCAYCGYLVTAAVA